MKLLRLWSIALFACTVLGITLATPVDKPDVVIDDGNLLPVLIPPKITSPANDSYLVVGRTFPFKYFSGFRGRQFMTQKIDIVVGTTGNLYPGIVYLATQKPLYQQIDVLLKPDPAKGYDPSKPYYLVVSETLLNVQTHQYLRDTRYITIKPVYLLDSKERRL